MSPWSIVYSKTCVKGETVTGLWTNRYVSLFDMLYIDKHTWTGSWGALSSQRRTKTRNRRRQTRALPTTHLWHSFNGLEGNNWRCGVCSGKTRRYIYLCMVIWSLCLTFFVCNNIDSKSVYRSIICQDCVVSNTPKRLLSKTFSRLSSIVYCGPVWCLQWVIIRW